MEKKSYYIVDGNNEQYNTLDDAKRAVNGMTSNDIRYWLRNSFGGFPTIDHILNGELVSVTEIKFDTVAYTITGFGKTKKC